MKNPTLPPIAGLETQLQANIRLSWQSIDGHYNESISQIGCTSL